MENLASKVTYVETKGKLVFGSGLALELLVVFGFAVEDLVVLASVVLALIVM